MTAITLLLSLCIIIHTSTSIPLNDFYPFGDGEGDSIVGPTLDGSSDWINLNQTFPFFKGNYTWLIVSFNMCSFVNLTNMQ